MLQNQIIFVIFIFEYRSLSEKDNISDIFRYIDYELYMKNKKSKQNNRPGCESTFSSRRVIGIGELLWDVYPDGRYLGGAPANFAFHVHHTGHHGIIVSRVGSDQLGDELIEQINLYGLETRWIQRDTQQKTGTVKVTLNRNGVPICTDRWPPLPT